MIELREYQREVVAAVEESPARRKLVVAPTGSGKSVIAAEIIRRRDKRVLFLVHRHRRELVHQARDHLRNIDIDAGIVLAGEESDPDARVQVASIQTLWTRAIADYRKAKDQAR